MPFLDSPSCSTSMPNTMLLTKRLATFLNNNTSPHIHTLLLLTPAGKLLTSASPLPASSLRTQATVACTLWNQYSSAQSENDLVSSVLPQTQRSSGRGAAHSGREPHPIGSIMVQLEYGIMVILTLKSGLLFIAIGPSASATSSGRSRMHSPEQPSSPLANTDVSEPNDRQISSPSLGSLGNPSGGSRAPSESGSVATNTSTTAANIMGLKRQTEELGKWLDGALDGFALSSWDQR
ncbi:hypothetical protein PVAG01_05788 [Phlyctema vagabunda]|uniref:Uncharacterized protein n=1 Tax=Phlyctema vagabunda TaxID=108571 RepID=A0ABR4PE69_9HELO